MKRQEKSRGSDDNREKHREAEMRRNLRLSVTLVAVLIAATVGALYTMMPDFDKGTRLMAEEYR